MASRGSAKRGTVRGKTHPCRSSPARPGRSASYPRGDYAIPCRIPTDGAETSLHVLLSVSGHDESRLAVNPELARAPGSPRWWETPYVHTRYCSEADRTSIVFGFNMRFSWLHYAV